MKKEKMTKEEKQAVKMKKDYEKICNLIGKEAADAMFIGLVKQGFEKGKISEDEYNILIQTFNGLKEGDQDESTEQI